MFKGTFLLEPVENLLNLQDMKGLDEYMKQKIGKEIETNLKNLLNKNFDQILKKKIFLFKNRYLYSDASTPVLNSIHPPIL